VPTQAKLPIKRLTQQPCSWLLCRAENGLLFMKQTDMPNSSQSKSL